MNYQNIEKSPLIKSYIEGSRRLSNVFWAFSVSAGGLGFFLSGLSSFFKTNLLFFSDSTGIAFIPQGIVLVFYGTVGSVLGIFLWLTIWWDIGFGYNEFSKDRQQVTLYRKGFPGKNREILLTYPLTTIQSIGIKISEGLNPQRSIYLCLKDNRKIPLTQVQEPISISELEKQAADLAKFLDLKLENL